MGYRLVFTGKNLLLQVLSSEFYEIFQNSYFIEHAPIRGFGKDSLENIGDRPSFSVNVVS